MELIWTWVDKSLVIQAIHDHIYQLNKENPKRYKGTIDRLYELQEDIKTKIKEVN